MTFYIEIGNFPIKSSLELHLRLKCHIIKNTTFSCVIICAISRRETITLNNPMTNEHNNSLIPTLIFNPCKNSSLKFMWAILICLKKIDVGNYSC